MFKILLFQEYLKGWGAFGFVNIKSEMEWREVNFSSSFFGDNISTIQPFLGESPKTTTKPGSQPQWYETGRITIPLYAVILMLAIIGNTLVILTLVSKDFQTPSV